jgi:hypothetical protein
MKLRASESPTSCHDIRRDLTSESTRESRKVASGSSNSALGCQEPCTSKVVSDTPAMARAANKRSVNDGPGGRGTGSYSRYRMHWMDEDIVSSGDDRRAVKALIFLGCSSRSHQRRLDLRERTFHDQETRLHAREV